MRPNTIHMVYTPAHSICLGDHFISTSTLGDTLYGLSHCLMGEVLITNTSHPEAVLLLQRFVHYFHAEFIKGHPDFDNLPGHLPDLRTNEGFMDFINLCSLTIFFNVLDPRTYQFPPSASQPDDLDKRRYEEYDLNAIPEMDRRRFAFSRGLCCQLIEWLDANFDLINPQDNSDELPPSCIEFFRKQVMHHGMYLIDYREKIDQDDEGVQEGSDVVPDRLYELPKLTNANLIQQVEWAIFTVPGITPEMWTTVFNGEAQHDYMVAEQEQQRYTPIRRDKPRYFQEVPLLPIEKISLLGLTEGDKRYFDAGDVGYPVMIKKASASGSQGVKRVLDIGAEVSTSKRLRSLHT